MHGGEVLGAQGDRGGRVRAVGDHGDVAAVDVVLEDVALHPVRRPLLAGHAEGERHLVEHAVLDAGDHVADDRLVAVEVRGPHVQAAVVLGELEVAGLGAGHRQPGVVEDQDDVGVLAQRLRAGAGADDFLVLAEHVEHLVGESYAEA
jgi:hypothetical protein